MVSHYDTNKQFNEDPQLGFLKSLSDMLHQVCNSSEKRKNHPNFTNVEQQKALFKSCATFIRTCAPDLYEEIWQEKFSPAPKRKSSVPKVREAVKVASVQFGNRLGISRSNDWERS